MESTSAAGWRRRGGPGVPAVLEGLRRCRGRGSQGQARDVAGHVRETLGVARIVTAGGARRHSYWPEAATGNGSPQSTRWPAFSAGLDIEPARITTFKRAPDCDMLPGVPDTRPSLAM
jgi:hypothetical protein